MNCVVIIIFVFTKIIFMFCFVIKGVLIFLNLCADWIDGVYSLQLSPPPFRSAELHVMT